MVLKLPMKNSVNDTGNNYLIRIFQQDEVNEFVN